MLFQVVGHLPRTPDNSKAERIRCWAPVLAGQGAGAGLGLRGLLSEGARSA